MCLKYIAAVGITLCLFSNLYASHSWFEGVVVLKDKTVINGEVSINRNSNIVQIRLADEIRAYSAFQVDIFYVNDTQIGFVRKFVSRPLEVRNRLFADMFFEEIIKGDISLLRKANGSLGTKSELKEEVYTESGFALDNDRYQDAMCYDYFFEVDGTVVKPERFKSELLPVLIANYDEVSAYLEEEKINAGELFDQILVIQFCNKLKGQRNPIFTFL